MNQPGYPARNGGHLAAPLWVVVWLLVAAPHALAQQALEGEYGLRVTEADGQVGVAWLTSTPTAGLLRVVAADSLLLEVQTPASESHQATFSRPDGDVVVQYGAAEASALHATTLYLGTEPPAESGRLAGVDSLYVVGDVHGEYDRLRRLLHNAGLVDQEARWSGGNSHVVFLGDIFDRGDDVTKTLWFMYRLEREARAAGGGSHVVLGNHETMIFTEDLRYVSPKELLVARLHGVSYRELFDIRETELGKWLASRPAVMWIDGALLAHGGVVPEIRPHSVPAVNDSMRSFLAEDLFYRWADSTMAFTADSALAESVREQYDTIFVMDSAAIARRMAYIFDERSILWYRGYVQSDTLAPELDETLSNFEADLHVVGHTPVPSVSLRYDGRVMAVDLEDPAREMLLLTRDARGARRAFRMTLEGPPEPLR
jgi:hypothetical protein